jgi:hypothetical protein
MKVSRWRHQLAIAVVCLNVCFGGIARGAQPVSNEASAMAAPVVATDVALTKGRTLDGQAVTASGAPIADSTVYAIQGGRVLATAQTDEQGWFSFAGMKGGVYQIEMESGASLVRAWTDASAPPAARPSALVVGGQDVALGQGPIRRFITNPWVWGIGIAGLVAIPVIIATTDKDEKVRGS